MIEKPEVTIYQNLVNSGIFNKVMTYDKNRLDFERETHMKNDRLSKFLLAMICLVLVIHLMLKLSNINPAEGGNAPQYEIIRYDFSGGTLHVNFDGEEQPRSKSSEILKIHIDQMISRGYHIEHVSFTNDGASYITYAKN